MKLVITQNITIDGVVEQNDQTGDWFSVADGAAHTTDLEETLRQMMSEEDGQLYGRKTFEAMRGFWPAQTDDETGVTDHLDTVDKYVISTTMSDPAWENSTVLSGELLDEVRSLKDRPGSNLGVTGSISVCHALIAAGLVDEYRLLLYPVVVGAGRQLFAGEGPDTRKLELVEAKPFTSGSCSSATDRRDQSLWLLLSGSSHAPDQGHGNMGTKEAETAYIFVVSRRRGTPFRRFHGWRGG